MKFADLKIGQIKLPYAETIKSGVLEVFGASEYADLFSGRLVLQTGDGSKETMGKGTGWGEGGSYNYTNS
jgi:hypothetical protein